MSYESNWANTTDVVRNHYGVRKISNRFGGPDATKGFIRTVNFVFDYDDLPEASEGGLEYVIPAYSTILRAYLEVLEAFDGTDGTNFLTVGLQQADGTEIDNDGLITVATVDDVDARGDVATGSGALIEASTGANDGQVVVTAGGTVTAGKGRLVVEYLPEGV